MKKYLNLLFLFLICSAYSQDTIVKRFALLSQYKKAGNKITQKDSANFLYRDGDTLVQISESYNFERNKNKVKVAYEPKDSTFLQLYKNVVYNTDKPSNNEQYMRYWKDSIKIYFEPGVSKNHSKELMKFASKISKDIDSLNIKQVFKAKDANYKVYNLNSKYNTDFEPRINAKSGYYVYWNDKNQIYKAALKSNTRLNNKEPYQLELLKYHFFRSLGYFHSSKKLKCESYLSNCKVRRKLTKIDLELLKYHYSYGICKGVNLKRFEELHTNMQAAKEKHANARLYVVHTE